MRMRFLTFCKIVGLVHTSLGPEPGLLAQTRLKWTCRLSITCVDVLKFPFCVENSRFFLFNLRLMPMRHIWLCIAYLLTLSQFCLVGIRNFQIKFRICARAQKVIITFVVHAHNLNLSLTYAGGY